MSDVLKKHIENQPEGFDIYPFDETAGWNSLTIQLKGKNRRIQWMSIAASFVLIIGMLFLMNNYKNSMVAIPQEISEAQLFYQDQIDAKLIAVSNHPDVEFVMEDLQALDEIFNELKNDLKDNAQNEEVVTAMIETYRMKLQILERILENIEEGK
jgi:uncharacterized radical SAM superfamily Fe-S cluster-containing enzyme